MADKIKWLKNLSAQTLRGKRVLLRLDLNVPLRGGQVADDFRLRQIVPTLDWLKRRGARVVIASHLGDPAASLKPVARHLGRLTRVGFYPGVDARAVIDKLPAGSALVLENLRRDPGEEKNSKTLARQLAKLADLYVNDAFASSHRAHASIVGVPKLLPSFGGLLLEKEIAELSRAFKPRHPFVFILGGAKVETKLPLLKKFLPLADKVFVGGALANDFFKARGWEMGRSMTGEAQLAKPFLNHPKISLPREVVIDDHSVKPADQVKPNEMILDTGPSWQKDIDEALAPAKFVLWNGPLGNFERGYGEATKKLATAISRSRAYSMVGGGDTVAAIAELGLMKKFNWLSTGGGAMLEFLATGTLPGIEALKKQLR